MTKAVGYSDLGDAILEVHQINSDFSLFSTPEVVLFIFIEKVAKLSIRSG